MVSRERVLQKAVCGTASEAPWGKDSLAALSSGLPLTF